MKRRDVFPEPYKTDATALRVSGSVDRMRTGQWTFVSSLVSVDSWWSAHTEAEAEAEAYKEISLRSPKKASAAKAARPAPSLEAIVSELQAMPAYTTLNVKHEADKCVAWWSVKGRSVTKRMVLNWLNRADVPLLNGHSPPQTGKGRLIQEALEMLEEEDRERDRQKNISTNR